MKAPTAWMMGGVCAGLLFSLIAFAPAAWLAAAIARGSNGAVILQAPRGTLWRGQANLILSGGAGSQGTVGLPSTLHWRIRPTWLGADVALDSLCCAPATSPALLSLKVSQLFSGGRVSWLVDAPRLVLPMQLLTGLGSPWNTLQLKGEMVFSSEKWAGNWSSATGVDGMTGKATLALNDLGTALSTVQPLGSYRLTSTNTALRLETPESAGNKTALLLSGTGEIQSQSLRFQGEAVAQKGFDEALSNLLHLIGQWEPNADGRARAILKL